MQAHSAWPSLHGWVQAVSAYVNKLESRSNERVLKKQITTGNTLVYSTEHRNNAYVCVFVLVFFDRLFVIVGLVVMWFKVFVYTQHGEIATPEQL